MTTFLELFENDKVLTTFFEKILESQMRWKWAINYPIGEVSTQHMFMLSTKYKKAFQKKSENDKYTFFLPVKIKWSVKIFMVKSKRK